MPDMRSEGYFSPSKEEMDMNPIELIHKSGVKSDYLFYAGFASIGLALTAWLRSRAAKESDTEKADRTGIFLGHWVPSFFALGVALQHYEDKHFKHRH
jgi:hypothetical protein